MPSNQTADRIYRPDVQQEQFDYQFSQLRHRSPVTKPSISVVIPALNEARNLPFVLPYIPPEVAEVVLVDGYSSDNTIGVARELYPNIIIVQDDKPGKGAALRRGFEACTGDYIVMIDADGSTDPREIPAYIQALDNGADFVKGSRNMQSAQSHDITPIRDMGNHGLRILVNILYQAQFTDLCYGYIAFKRKDLKALDLDSDGFEIETEMIVRALDRKLSVVEIPSTEHLRRHGSSNLHAIRDGLRILNVILSEYLKQKRFKTFFNQLPAAGLAGSKDAKRIGANASVHVPAKKTLATTSETKHDGSISTIICAYTLDRWEQLKAAVESVHRQQVKNVECIVVIDHNTALYSLARETFKNSIVIENTGPTGLSGARNTGIANSRSEFLVFLDDDAVATDAWLAKLIAPMRDKTVMGVSGQVEPQWEKAKPAWFPVEFQWVVGCSYRGLPTDIAPIRNVIGSNMCLRRSVCISAGGFRTDIGRIGTLPVGCEETELCIRASQINPAGVFLQAPSAIVRHFVPQKRSTYRYFLSRCYHEGRSKAMIAHAVGSRASLASERLYTRRILPSGIFKAVDQALHGDAGKLLTAAAIITGFAATAAGYIAGRITHTSGQTSITLHAPNDSAQTLHSFHEVINA